VSKAVVGAHFDFSPSAGQLRQVGAEAVCEFGCSLVGESDAQHLFGGDAVFAHGSGEAERHRRGLAGAGACSDPQREQRVLDDLGLFGRGNKSHVRYASLPSGHSGQTRRTPQVRQ
jgi:hypothetical protein